MKQMNQKSKSSLLIILIYIVVQLIPVIFGLFTVGTAFIYLNILTFGLGTIAMIFVERKYQMIFHFEKTHKNNAKNIWIWGLLGVPLAYITQILASIIETGLLNISPTSTNTNVVMEIIRQYPVFLIFVSIFGPIMEEYVFRKAIGGLLVERIGWVGAAVISALVFSAVHLDGHYLIYASLGLLFSYLYYKSGNLLSPIIAHVLMNTLVVLSTFLLA